MFLQKTFLLKIKGWFLCNSSVCPSIKNRLPTKILFIFPCRSSQHMILNLCQINYHHTKRVLEASVCFYSSAVSCKACLSCSGWWILHRKWPLQEMLTMLAMISWKFPEPEHISTMMHSHIKADWREEKTANKWAKALEMGLCC